MWHVCQIKYNIAVEIIITTCIEMYTLNIYEHIYVYTYIKFELSKLQGTKWKSMMPFMYWLKTI